MRSTDIVRQVLDLLDEIEGPHDLKQPDEKNCGCGQDPCITYGTQEPEQGEPIAGRFKQIFAMLNNRDDGEYANTPNEIKLIDAANLPKASDTSGSAKSAFFPVNSL